MILSIISYACNLRSWKVETGESVVPGQFELCSEFEASLGFMKSCLNKRKAKQFSCVEDEEPEKEALCHVDQRANGRPGPWSRSRRMCSYFYSNAVKVQ